MTADTIDSAAGHPAPAPVVRRIGAHLLDCGVGMLVVYLVTVPMALAFAVSFGSLYVAFAQAFAIGWAVFKDAWWPGQSLGKKAARIRIVGLQTGLPATRMRCVARQAIFALLLAAINLPAFLYLSQSVNMAHFALTSSVLSTVAPERLVTVLFPREGSPFILSNLPYLLVPPFILVEAFLVYARSDRRRIVDLLAGTKVVDDRGARPS